MSVAGSFGCGVGSCVPPDRSELLGGGAADGASTSVASGGQSGLGESYGDGRYGDVEVLSQCVGGLDAVAPGSFEESSWYEQAAGEVVGGLLALCFCGVAPTAGVKPCGAAVVDDVLVLVSQGEPLPGTGFVAVEGDDPLLAVPVAGAGYRKVAVDDSEAGEFGDEFAWYRSVVDVEQAEQLGGLEFSHPERFVEGDRLPGGDESSEDGQGTGLHRGSAL